MRENQKNTTYIPMMQSKEFLGSPLKSNIFDREGDILVVKSGKKIVGKQVELQDNPIIPMTGQQERLNSYE